jgi:hypothetical protein
MTSLTAASDVGGRAIHVALTWSDPFGQARSLRILRRRWGVPTGPSDGLAVLDLADLFSPSDEPWARIDTSRFLLVNPRAEGGVLQAEVAGYFGNEGDVQPAQVAIRLYGAATDALVTTMISSVTRVESTPGTDPGFGAVTKVTIYTQPVVGPEVPAATWVVLTGNLTPGAPTVLTDYGEFVDGTDTPGLTKSTPNASPSLLQWTPSAQAVTGATPTTPIRITTANAHWLTSGATVVIAGVTGNTAANGIWAVTVTGAMTFTLDGSSGQGSYAGGGTAAAATTSLPFVSQETRSTAATVRGSAPLHVSFVTTHVAAAGPVPIRKIDFTDSLSADTGNIDRSIAIDDRDPPTRSTEGFEPGLLPGATYYYAAFEDTAADVAPLSLGTASAVATGRYGFAAKLYALLPAVHRYYDDPASGQLGSWQLRRFLEVFGPGLDQARSFGEGLRTLHDLFEVRADFLPYLAHLIGWQPDLTLPTARQRNDILLAPEVYATVGTVPNVQAMVNRATGWDCEVKEFVHNVFLTNAIEPIRLWEIWEAGTAAGAFSATAPVAPTPDTTAIGDSVDARPAVVADPGGGAPWLFWQSNRSVPASPALQRHIWMMRADGTSTPVVVATDAGSTGNQCPAAVADVIAGVPVIRLFWSSTRGEPGLAKTTPAGRPNLWTLTVTPTGAGAVIGAAAQLTDHPAGDDFPAAVNLGGTIWLFWQSSRRGPMDIWAITLAAGVWSSPQRITGGDPDDQAPSAVVDGAGRLNLFWSADLGDRSRIYTSLYDAGSGAWSARQDVSSNLPPALVPPVTQTFRDEAPAAAVSAGNLWLFWHSDRDGIVRVYATQQTGATWSAPFPLTTGRSSEKDPAPFVTAGSMRLFFRTQRGGEVYRSRTVDMSNIGLVQPGMASDRWHYTYATAGTSGAVYARDAVGLYMTPNEGGTTADHQSESARVQALVEPFRPVPARFMWFVQPVVDAETVYTPGADIGESYTDSFPYVDALGAVGESTSVALPDWVVIHTNSTAQVTADPNHLVTLQNRVFYPAFT